MQLNSDLTKNAKYCDSMLGQDLGGLNASREAFDEIAGLAPELTKLRHSELTADFSPSILVGVGVAMRPLLTPVPTGERVWVRDQILRRMVQVDRATRTVEIERGRETERPGNMYTIALILGALDLLRWMFRQATCVMNAWLRRMEMGSASFAEKK